MFTNKLNDSQLNLINQHWHIHYIIPFRAVTSREQGGDPTFHSQLMSYKRLHYHTEQL